MKYTNIMYFFLNCLEMNTTSENLTKNGEIIQYPRVYFEFDG